MVDFRRENLLPVLLHLPGLDAARIAQEGMGPEAESLEAMFAFRPLAADLGVALAVDAPAAHAGHEQLESWGITLDEGLAIAADNLRRLQPPRFDEAAPGLYVARLADATGAARLLLPELARHVVAGGEALLLARQARAAGEPIRSSRQADAAGEPAPSAWQTDAAGEPMPSSRQALAAGEPVAMVPNPEHLLLASSSDGAALEHMVARAQELLQAPQRLSAAMLRLEQGQWRPWLPPQEPAATMLHNLQQGVRAADYDAQSQVLRQVLDRSGEDIFLADHGLLRAEGKPRVLSLTTLAHEVHAWLPVADVIAIQPPGGEVQDTLLVPWAAFEAIARDCLQPLACLPLRYAYRGGLGEAQFARLRAAAVTLGEAVRAL